MYWRWEGIEQSGGGFTAFLAKDREQASQRLKMLSPCVYITDEQLLGHFNAYSKYTEEPGGRMSKKCQKDMKVLYDLIMDGTITDSRGVCNHLDVILVESIESAKSA